jgi:predicted GNAT family acetyltransferase
VTRTDDVITFAAQTRDWLQRDPYRNNVVATVIRSRAQPGYPVEPDALWLTVHEGPAIAGVALMTPPRGALLSQMSAQAAAAVADWFADNAMIPPTVDSVTDVAAAFRRAYAKRVGVAPVRRRTSRLYALEQVRPPTAVPGLARPAVDADRDLLITWQTQFLAEINAPDDAAVAVDQRLSGDRLVWLWQVDRRPASMAWLNEPVGGVSRVSAVFTPPQLRQHGYASAVVAAVSQHALDRGSAACMLYTDLANPTSNKIYQTVGYRPVDDAEMWSLA